MLDLYIRDGPKHPRPFDIFDGEEMLICISICHETDRTADREILVQVLTLLQSSPILNNISIIGTLYNSVSEHARFSLIGFTEPDLSVESRHRISGSTI